MSSLLTEYFLCRNDSYGSPSVPFGSSGPWFIGELIDGHSGACFAFGVFIDGHFLEGSLTYVVGVVQVRQFAFCQLYLSVCLSVRFVLICI